MTVYFSNSTVALSHGLALSSQVQNEYVVSQGHSISVSLMPTFAIVCGVAWCVHGVRQICCAPAEEGFSAQRQRGRESLTSLALGISAIAVSVLFFSTP